VRFFVGVSAAFSAGTLIGVALGIILSEEKQKAKYTEATGSFIRAMELARSQEPPKVVEIDDGIELTDILPKREVPATAIKQADVEDFKPKESNPYHEAKSNPAPSWTYLEQEDYEDDDGRFKGQIIIMPNEEGQAVFVENDIEISDWETKIGSNILRDFYALVPPNSNPPVLYVRNNLTDEDYEVIKQVP